MQHANIKNCVSFICPEGACKTGNSSGHFCTIKYIFNKKSKEKA